jgi:hypothetical protein
MKRVKISLALICAVGCFLSTTYAQVLPVTLSERVKTASYIVMGELKEQHGFWDAAHERLNTLNVFEVNAYLKGKSTRTSIAVITEGGQLDLFAVHACPSDELDAGKTYMLFLKNEEEQWQDKDFKSQNPQILQTKSHFTFAVLPYQNGKYNDLFGRFAYTESQLLNTLKADYQLDATTPSDKTYSARIEPPAPNGLLTVTSITDGTGTLPASGFVSGTIVANNEIIINGSGFGSTSGTIEFPNADDGGTTVQPLTNASDLISWSDVQIRAKIPRRAGTGTLTVKNTGGTAVGTAAITIAWAEICLDQAARDAGCALTGASLRHRLELANVDGTGGYLFRYNDGTGASANFSTNVPAREAFARAVSTWRCATAVNFGIAPAATSTGFNSGDGISVILYDNTLGTNVLAVCYTGYGGSCNTGCTSGVRWYHTGMDIRILTVPVTGLTWNYSTSAPSFAQYDFESVMLHELGHGHGLGHVNDVAKTMHYSVSNGASKRVLSAAEIAAGTFKMAHSTATQCLGTDKMTAITGACTVLPVEFTQFAGINKSDKNILNWQTATEVNNSHFVVQRSKDGEKFTDIGTIKANGTTGTPQYYDFVDALPYAGINYYRLQQVDRDGKSELSKTITVSTPFGNKKTVNIYPNPSHNVLTVEHNTDVKTLDIVNTLGQVVRSIKTTQNAAQTDIVTTDLTDGIYFLRVNQSEMVRFVKH